MNSFEDILYHDPSIHDQNNHRFLRGTVMLSTWGTKYHFVSYNKDDCGTSAFA